MSELKRLKENIQKRQKDYMKLAQEGKDVPAYEVQFYLQMIIGSLDTLESEYKWKYTKNNNGFPEDDSFVVVVDKNDCCFLAYYTDNKFVEYNVNANYELTLTDIVKWKYVLDEGEEMYE